MLMKIILVPIFLQIASIQIFTRVQAAIITEAQLLRLEAELANLKEELNLIYDELHHGEKFIQEGDTLISERMDGLEARLEAHKAAITLTMTSTTTTTTTTAPTTTKTTTTTTTTTPTTTTTTTTPTTTHDPETKPRSCKEWLQGTERSDKYNITPSATSNLYFEAYCLLQNDGGEISFWTVILRRKDGSLDFNRNWQEYQRGFGNLNDEFFLGLDYIYALTQSAQQELWIQVENKYGKKGWAKYDHFRIGDSTASYELKSLGHYSGNAGDGLEYSYGHKWSTKDVHNDDISADCALKFGGGWWFDSCARCCLTGYYDNSQGTNFGIHWNKFIEGSFHISYAQMAIRELG